jgi:hypothetical protein
VRHCRGNPAGQKDRRWATIAGFSFLKARPGPSAELRAVKTLIAFACRGAPAGFAPEKGCATAQSAITKQTGLRHPLR